MNSQFDPIEIAPGMLFAEKYRIIDVVGRGGMGIVYKAEHILINRTVALKTLSGDNIDSKSAARFQREASAAAALTHANLVAVHDFGIVNGVVYMIMDFIEGRTLAEEIAEVNHLTLSRFLDIFSQACAGLAHAHSLGVIHRDIKCGNIMLTQRKDGQNVVKVVDFGLAKVIRPITQPDWENLSSTGTVLGSPAYMSPEQCRGREVDARSDIYSLGCVMYQAISGQLPLWGNDVFEIMSNHVKTKPSRLCEAYPHLKIEPKIDNLILSMLEKEPGRRPQSMDAVAEVLTAVQTTGARLGNLNSTESIDTMSNVPGQSNSTKVSKSNFANTNPDTLAQYTKAVSHGVAKPVWQRYLPAIVSALAIVAGSLALLTTYRPAGTKPLRNVDSDVANTRALVTEIAQRVDKGDYNGGMPFYSRLRPHINDSKLFPIGDAELPWKVGLMAYNGGFYSEAEHLFLQSYSVLEATDPSQREIASNMAGLLNFCGKCREGQGAAPEARDFYQRAIKIAPAGTTQQKEAESALRELSRQ